MIKSTMLLVAFLGLWLCTCFTVSIDTAYRRTWEATSRENRELYLGLKAILTDDQADSFLQMTDEKQREEWLRKLWKSKDPTPTTERNEFKEEHERRVAYAKYYFGSYFKGERLWDDRGKVYVKYGEPDERTTNLSGVLEDIGKTFPDATPYFDMLAGEFWNYYRYNLQLQFQDKRGNGYYELVPYAEDIKLGYSKQNLEAIFAAEMISKIEIPTEKYAYDYGGEPLDYALDVIRFRNSKDDYEISVNIGVPLGQLGRKDTNYISFLKSIVIFDNDYREVNRDGSEINTKVEQTVNSLAVSWSKFILKPGEYTIAVEVRDLISQRVGIYKKSILLPGYVYSAQREISQIVMATDIKEATLKDTLLMQRNGLLISCLPSRIYFPDQKIYFYYEIYDLKTDQEGKGYYIIQADLVNTKTRKRVNLYTTNPIECRSSDTYEMDIIDASKLKPADYILYIKVKDVLADKEKKTVTAFRVEDK